MGFAPWTGATECSDGPTPGTKALLAWALDHHPQGYSLGIYNCRSVVGGSTTSTHGEGRAVDVGFPMRGGRGSPAGHKLVRQLLPVADHIGVQCIIYDRTIWSQRSPNGRPYTGAAPHYNHVHIELTRKAGQRLNVATLRRWLGTSGSGSSGSASSDGGKGGRNDSGRELLMALPTRRRGDEGLGVKTVQGMLDAHGWNIAHPYDGVFGPHTEDCVRGEQRRHGATVDGIVGPQTYSILLTPHRDIT